ncbi:MAG: ACT domain-containing protein [Chloroflexi bacterium]|nr:ACT domain-containing protein [Chloroflexota bacterium]
MPPWVTTASFWSATRSPEELSVVCPGDVVPAGVRAEPGWRAFRVHGPLDLSLVGVLARLMAPLAPAGIPVFALSTFDTDYLLVPSKRLPVALSALRDAGYAVSE